MWPFSIVSLQSRAVTWSRSSDCQQGDTEVLFPQFTTKTSKGTSIANPGPGLAKIFMWLGKTSNYNSAVHHRATPFLCSTCPETGCLPGLFQQIHFYLSVSFQLVKGQQEVYFQNSVRGYSRAISLTSRDFFTYQNTIFPCV